MVNNKRESTIVLVYVDITIVNFFKCKRCNGTRSVEIAGQPSAYHMVYDVKLLDGSYISQERQVRVSFLTIMTVRYRTMRYK